MPSVKIPKKSTFVDMTPFVDVAFLILTFFIMATKFKPPEPVVITTPKSVSTAELPESNAVLITIDKEGKVYFSALSQKDPEILKNLAGTISSIKTLGLSDAEKETYKKTVMVGVPFTQLKGLLDIAPEQQAGYKQPGIPVDTTGGELTFWIQAAATAFQGQTIRYMIKGDNDSKYPVFKDVIEAFKKNEIYKYNLITSPEDAPEGTELYKERHKAG